MGYITIGLWVTRMSCLPKLSELYTGGLDILPNVSGAENKQTVLVGVLPDGKDNPDSRPHQVHHVEPCSSLLVWDRDLSTPPRHSPNKLPRDESVGSLGHHWGSWVGEAIQSGWGLLDGEGRLLELSLPFSFAGERGTPSPVNQNPGSETPHGGEQHSASPTYH